MHQGDGYMRKVGEDRQQQADEIMLSALSALIIQTHGSVDGTR